MIEEMGRRLRGAYEKRRRLTVIEWLVVLLCVLALVGTAYYTVVQLNRQGRSRQMLAQLKAARLAASVVSTECYAMGKPFADFAADDGLAAGLQQSIRTLGALPGTVRLLQTDTDGYGVQSLAYQEGEYVAIYDADGSWKIYRTEHRITTTFDPAN